MSLLEVEAARPAGVEQSLAGALERLTVRSEALEDNPLGDSPVRPLLVYMPPDADDRRLPSVYFLQGFAGRVEEWLAADTIEQLDAMITAGECPPAILVFIDAFTSRGGSQFLNSSGCGRYLDYVCDEAVPFVDARYPTLAERDHRGLSGKSSGGYGALVLSMLRPELFGALASHAGDALFECCYQPVFPQAARQLRSQFTGSWQRFEERIAQPDFNWRDCAALFAESHADSLRGMRRIYLDAGRSDEFFLDLGAQALSDEFTRLGVEHSLELFDGNHDGVNERMPRSACELVRALQ